MAQVDFQIKQGDTLPAIEATLQEPQLETATEVRLNMRLVVRRGMPRPAALTGVATIDDLEQGIVSYAWKTGDTLTPGRYAAEWQVTYADNHVLTFPNDGYFYIEITPQVA